jgi:putative endonuclease
MAYYVYLLASKKHGTLYLGVTNDIVRRVYEHRTKAVPGFTKRYGVDRLVWFEIYDDALAAIAREKELKKWRRDWKIRLIEEQNPGGRISTPEFQIDIWGYGFSDVQLHIVARAFGRLLPTKGPPRNDEKT